MIIKIFFRVFFLLITILILSVFFYIQNLKKTVIINEDTYYLLGKNTPQEKILKQLQLKKINIENINWRITSFFRKDKLVPKAGEYLLLKNSNINDIQNLFHKGKTITRHFRLIEGSTSLDLKNNLLKNPYLTGKIKKLKEGIYKPDTYYFKYGYSRNKLLMKMKLAQDKVVNKIWKNRPNDFILKNKDELLILASIIQSESNNLNDSKLVASVFINRLKKNMKLQSDVTLAYGFNINGKNITKKMLKSRNAFNTYYFRGLPPTPISYPGENALNSLKEVKKTDYLYFVSDGKGGHRFSKTYSLHMKNVKLWRKNIIKD